MPAKGLGLPAGPDVQAKRVLPGYPKLLLCNNLDSETSVKYGKEYTARVRNGKG